MATLVVKLGTALLKQISKPAAKQLTNYVLNRPKLRQQVVYGARVRSIVIHRASVLPAACNLWIRVVNVQEV